MALSSSPSLLSLRAAPLRALVVAALAALALGACSPAGDDGETGSAPGDGEETTLPGDPPPAMPDDEEGKGPRGDGALTGAMCGGIAGMSCANPSDYCRYPLGQCRLPDAAGTCTVKSDICTREYRPVCGCDGQTYPNACEAGSAGVSVFSEGACAADLEQEAVGAGEE